MHRRDRDRIYIDRSLPGDRLIVNTKRTEDGLIRGEILRVAQASPHRVAPPTWHGGLRTRQVDVDDGGNFGAVDALVEALDVAGVMTEPPNGLPDLRAVIEAVEALNRPIFGIVEQDMYPVAFDVPMPIAKRTRNYLLSCGSRTAVN